MKCKCGFEKTPENAENHRRCILIPDETTELIESLRAEVERLNEKVEDDQTAYDTIHSLLKEAEAKVGGLKETKRLLLQDKLDLCHDHALTINTMVAVREQLGGGVINHTIADILFNGVDISIKGPQTRT